MAVETSIVIRTLNEAKHLGDLLKGIHGQNYQDWEIILVDSGSTDGTLDIAREYGAHIYHIPTEEFTYGRSLNIGCAKAQGCYLVFASGHVRPITNNWLRNITRPLDDPQVAMVYGRQRGTDLSRLSELRDLDNQFGTTSQILVDEPKGNNGNAAVRRDLWLQQPFDESLPGQEDIDWARKAEIKGFRVYYAADAGVYHIHEETLGQVYQRYLREAMATKQMFPNFRLTWVDMARGLPFAIVRDILYAFRLRKPNKVFQIPGTRLAYFLGIYRGTRYRKALARNVTRNLRVPDSHRTVVIEGPGQHLFKSITIPEVRPDEALVQVAFVGVTKADLEAAGLHGDDQRNGAFSYPIVPGLDYSGIVVRSGSRASHLRRGQKVVGVIHHGCGVCTACTEGDTYRCSNRGHDGFTRNGGAYAEYVAVPASQLYELPLETPLKHGALMKSVAMCLDGVAKLEVAPGRTACIVGAGPWGNLCAQILRSRGIGVTSVDANSRWLSLLDKYDIDTLGDLGPVESYDYLIETDGGQSAVPRFMANANPSAKVLVLGKGRSGDAPGYPGSTNRYHQVIFAAHPSKGTYLKEAIRLVGNGNISLEDHTAAVAPLADYEGAWAGVGAEEHFNVLLSASRDLEAL